MIRLRLPIVLSSEFDSLVKLVPLHADVPVVGRNPFHETNKMTNIKMIRLPIRYLKFQEQKNIF